MHTGIGGVAEVYLDRSARIDCAPELIPAPGQYLLGHDNSSDSPLPTALFFYEPAPNGFRFAPPVPVSWHPGTSLSLRGPLGHGFAMPSAARKAALIAWDDSPARLRGLISLALKDNQEVVLICDSAAADVPEAVEVQPLQAAKDVCAWADFIAADVARENLAQLREFFAGLVNVPAAREAQILVRAPMPCGGLAACGVCAVGQDHAWKMGCIDGPVFIMKELFRAA